jgi:hypothetical protein
MVDPVSAKVVRDVNDFEVVESHPAKFFECGPDVRTLGPGAAAAVDHEELMAIEVGNRLA